MITEINRNRRQRRWRFSIRLDRWLEQFRLHDVMRKWTQRVQNIFQTSHECGPISNKLVRPRRHRIVYSSRQRQDGSLMIVTRLPRGNESAAADIRLDD